MILRNLRHRLGLYTAEEVRELAAKANPALPGMGLELTGAGGVQPTGQDFEKYLHSVGIFHVVSACIDAIGKAAATIPLRVMVNGAEADSHPLADLLKNPNPEQGDFSFRYAISQQTGYTGEAYITSDTPFSARLEAGRHDIWVQRSDRMAPILDRAAIRGGKESNPIKHWEYTGAEKVVLPVDQVIQVRWPHPYDSFRGLSPLKQLESVLRVEYQLMNAAASYYKNGMRPSGVFKRNTRPSEADIQRFKTEIGNAYGGADNAGKVLFLWGDDLSFEQMADSMKDAGSLPLMSELKKAVMSVYKTPPIVLGDPDGNTWATSREQKALFYENAVKPNVELLLDTLNSSDLVRAYGPNVEIIPDYSGVEALQPDRKAQAETDVAYVAAKIMTVNEVREMRAIGEPVEWGDEPPAPPPQLMPGPSPFEDEPAEDDEDEETTDEKRRRYVARARKATDKATARDLRWRGVLERTAPIERAWARKVRGLLRDLEADVLARIEEVSGESVKASPATWASEVLVDVGKQLSVWLKVLQPLAESTYKTGAEDLLEDVAGIFVPFDVTSPGAQAFINDRLARNITGVLDTQRSMIHSLVADGAAEGQTTPEIAGAIRSTFRSSTPAHALRIARTETAGLYNAGAQDGMQEAGIEQKEWLSARDELVRETHAEADGQRVPLGQPFVVGAGQGMYPGGIGLPEEDINCRCAVIAAEGFEG